MIIAPRKQQRKMSRYAPMTSLLFFIINLFLLFQYVTSQLPSAQMTTMARLHELLKKNSNSKWNSSETMTDPCSWPGVVCSVPNNSSIIGLYLSSFSLSSTTNESLSLVCEIDTLQGLDLSNSHLTLIPQTFISSCGGIAGLKFLNFSKNRLSGGLPSFQGFGSLEVLDLSHNSFDGVSIDLQFDGLNGLKTLNLSYCNFSGSFPTRLGNSMLLEELQLSVNSFQGKIPEEIANHSNLTLLDLGANQLNGSIPSRIGELSNLQLLVLSANKLTGEIPQSISGITSLRRFAANQNAFTGMIPRGITRYLRNLDLSYNKLNGSIPGDLLSQSNLLTVDLSYNMLEGSVPSHVSERLVRLRLGSNRLRGSIPSWSFGTNIPALTYLEVDNNSLSGTIPRELGLFRNLTLLDLSQNKLVGFIPLELGYLSKLQVLNLQLNNLFGEIPNEVTQLGSLERLNISWNSLNGSIPSSISRLQQLRNLDLQANNLNGGIPDSFGNMNSLLELQLGKNQLGGVIRSLPISLQIALNISHNNFDGPIPHALSRLNALEVLDLSNNRFSGDVPTFFTRMGSLTLLDLSHNQLSGTLPKFSTHVAVVSDGNRDLDDTTSNPSPPATGKKKAVSVGIVLAAAAAVLALAILVLLALLFSGRIHKVNDDQQHESQPQVIKSNMLTVNVIHRSNLDFTKAMEDVAYASNVILKTRFSTYYKAIMPSGMEYFVKKLNWNDKIFQLGSHDQFEEELEVLGRLRNSSVMIPLAYVLAADSAYIFYEFAEKGTLFDVLHGSLGNVLNWTHRYSIAVGLAHGLNSLHCCPSGPIILLDFSSRIVMLKSLNEPQIGDIELCKVIDPSKSTSSLSTVAGSVGYIPPEYAYTMRVTMAGNVYSFGVILLELLTGRPAVSEGSELAKWALSKSAQQDKLDQILDSPVSRTSSAVREQMLAVLKVALACVSVSPEARPKMRSVLRMLLNTTLTSQEVSKQ